MSRIWLACAVSLLFSSTTGCITGRVAEASAKWRRPKPEVLTATSASSDERAPLAVVALEAECRVAPGDPEGGPGAAAYTLERAPGLAPDEERFLTGRGLEPTAAYHASKDPERAPWKGAPEAVLVGERDSEHGALFVKTPSGWSELPVRRFLHKKASRGHAVLATTVEAVALPFTIVADLATFPIQWFLAPWFPITPP